MLLPNLCWGWGFEGHRIIAIVAQDHLNETTKIMIQSLIGNNHLYSIASWADDIRRDRPETGTWYYVDNPFGSTYDASRDCAPPRSCVVEKIGEFAKTVADKIAPHEQRTEALGFLVHFVEDIHQPMHAAAEAAGGYAVRVCFLGSDRCGRYECNLHAVWDTSLIAHTGLDPHDYADRLERVIKAENLTGQNGGTPEEWANESLRLAQRAWVPDEADLGETYYREQIKIVDRQMALAALRLAKLLNDSIGKTTPTDFK